MTKLEKSYYEEDLIGAEPKSSGKPVTEMPEDLIGAVASVGNQGERRRLGTAIRLATEYVKDYNLEMACLRCDIDYDKGKRIYKTGEFARALQHCIQIITPEEVITSQEILHGYKEIAFSPFANASARISALDKLNRFVTGMKPKDDLDEGGNLKDAVPVVNITLTQNNGNATGHKPALTAEHSISVNSD